MRLISMFARHPRILENHVRLLGMVNQEKVIVFLLIHLFVCCSTAFTKVNCVFFSLHHCLVIASLKLH